MYEFIDINEAQSSSSLPPEAMSYNGVFLENEIVGYKTLNVSGRELMEAEVSDKSIEGINGSQYYSKRYPSRTITVTYQLIAETNEAFRSAFNKLNRLLDAEQVQIIFNDEIDKYFIGTKVGNSTPDAGLNSIVGEIEIYCTDPHKYSVAMKEFTASVNSDGILECTIENDGGVPVSIDYEIYNNQDDGYIGIVSDEGAMEFGSIEEADGETVQQTELLATLSDFINAKDDTSGTDYMHPNYGANGTLSTAKWYDTTFLKFGTVGTKKGSASGGLRTITLKADSNGDTGCKNFYAYFHVLFYAGLMGQTGEMCINFLTSDNKLMCGVNWYKTDVSGNTGEYELVCYNPNAKSSDANGGRVLKHWTYTTSHLHSENPWFWNWGHCDLRKEGSKLTFFYWGSYPSFDIPEVKDMECAKVQIAIKQYGNRSGSQFMTYCGMDIFSFYKLQVDKWKDNPNRYAKGSTVTIDGSSAKFYVNDMQKQEDEVLGTQYFKAPVGSTIVKFYQSSWVTNKPTVKAYIREAWL